MSAPAQTRPVMLNGHLYHSPRGLYGFQADAVAQAYLYGTRIGVVDVGLGKTHISMALAAQLFEDGEIDLVILVCRRNKLLKTEFPAEWAEFTSLRTLVYHGAGRQNRLTKHGIPDVLMTTYDTGRNELMARVKKDPKQRGKGGRADGPLMDKLRLRDKRILWIFDEIPRLKTRTSELYQAYDYVLNQLRRGPHRQRVLGLTATPMSTDYEQPFNIARLVEPSSMPSVGEFEREFTHGRDDQYGRYIYRKGAQERFADLFQRLEYRKRFTDPDVIDQYPKLVEKLIMVELDPGHRALYDAVGRLFGDEPEQLTQTQRDQLNTAQRLTLGHPRAHLRSTSQLSKAITATLGEDGLRGIVSSKTVRLLEELETMVRGQGAQVLVYTFYAETVLPELATDLREAGYSVVTYTSGASDSANSAAISAFKEGRAQVLLSSDAGSEGFNLPEAHYIVEYESARTYETRTQRFGRGTRITSGGGVSVFALTMVAEKTIEVGTLNTVLHRNKLQDTLLGDTGADGHTGAEDRRRQLRGTA